MQTGKHNYVIQLMADMRAQKNAYLLIYIYLKIKQWTIK